jgi:superfamily II DNA or RNA helicase
VANLRTLLAQLHTEPTRRGREFERICKWFLINDPVYSADLRCVWLWDEWPGRWGADAGIDLVAEDYQGRLWAIQAKAYDPSTTITKRDVDTFLAESGRPKFAFRLLIATTDLIGHTAKRTIEGQEKPASVALLGDLEAAQVNWPRSPSSLQAPKLPPKRPRAHQLEAINKVVRGFEAGDRGQLIMACGTGKTLTALFVQENLAANHTLVLVPSLSLLAQTLREWTTNSTLGFTFLAVCSDETVADPDAPISNTSDLGLPATTDPQDIAAFLRRSSGPTVIFATYQSSPQVAAASTMGGVPRFDLVVADEAHRCAGSASPGFGTVLNNEAIRTDRRLFMTATPRYLTARTKKAAMEADLEVASMDDEAAFGPVFHRLSFGEAIKRKLLTDYQVVVVGVDNDEYHDWAQRGEFVRTDGNTVTDARTLASQIGLAKAMRRYDLHRTITFHSRVKRAQDFARELPRLIEWLPARQRPGGHVWSDFVSGEMPAGQRHILIRHLDRLDSDERGLLANARCLAEGVDLPTLDCVAFIDPRGSEVDIVQAVGRAIRLAKDKTIGTIVIPVFINTSQDAVAALNDSAFRVVWDIIKALRSHDDELGEYLDGLRRELGRQRQRPRRPGKIRLDLPRSVSAEFARVFDVRLVEYTTASWEFWFGLLERFVEQNGHACPLVEFKVDEYALGEWANTQRDRRSRGTLDTQRQDRLGKLPGWSWDPNADKWEEGFRHLLEYAGEHGDAAVPPRFIFNGYRLGQWTMVQRAAKGRDSLEADRVQRLETVSGWSFDPRGDKWEEGFNHLLDYFNLHGDARVPRSHTIDGYNLGGWVKSQRRAYNKGSLDASRRDRLGALKAWTWDAIGDRWEEGFDRLLEYIERNGDALVPASYEIDSYRLGAWVAVQRAARVARTLDPDRETRLHELPEWTWSGREASWDEGFTHLQDYVNRNDSALVPASCKHDDYPLGQWVVTQRQFHAQGTLSHDREARLKVLPGWTWSARDAQWLEGFNRLRDYIAANGHALVPKRGMVDGYRLGAWVGLQRMYRSKGTLDQSRVKQLDSLPEWRWQAK